MSNKSESKPCVKKLMKFKLYSFKYYIHSTTTLCGFTVKATVFATQKMTCFLFLTAYCVLRPDWWATLSIDLLWTMSRTERILAFQIYLPWSHSIILDFYKGLNSWIPLFLKGNFCGKQGNIVI